MDKATKDLIKLKPHLKELLKPVKKNKFGAEKTKVDGVKFDSKAESKRYSELKMLEKAGVISNLELQPKFLIIPGVVWNGKKLRERYYIADFKYTEDSRTVVEDTKGFKTELYKLKRSLFLSKYPEYHFVESK